jgi:hypothetical protein
MLVLALMLGLELIEGEDIVDGAAAEEDDDPAGAAELVLVPHAANVRGSVRAAARPAILATRVVVNMRISSWEGVLLEVLGQTLSGLSLGWDSSPGPAGIGLGSNTVVRGFGRRAEFPSWPNAPPSSRSRASAGPSDR